MDSSIGLLPRWAVMVMLLACTLTACDGSSQQAQFSLSVQDLIDGELGYFDKPHSLGSNDSGDATFTWHHSGLMTVVLAADRASPIRQINCAMLLGDMSALSGTAGILAITKAVNMGREELTLDNLTDLLTTEQGSDYLHAGNAELRIASRHQTDEDKRLVVVHIVPTDRGGA